MHHEVGVDAERLASKRAYGDDLASRFWLETPSSHVTRSLKRGVLAVTQIKSGFPTPEPSQSIGYDEAYLVGLMVRDVPDHELWQDGRAVKTPAFRGGDTALFDLRRDPISYTRTAHHSLHFYLPRTALSELADQSGARFGGELSFQFATGYDDPVVRQLGGAVLLAFENGDASDGFFLDHILNAVAAHVLRHYGDAAYSTRHAAHGGLTARQLRSAKEFMRAHLGRDILLAQLADLCGLSATHFARAFRQSTGTSPHRWLLDQRIEHAKRLLLEEGALLDVALDCGFADQSHFTRTFTKHVGTSPGRWRRSQS